MKHILASITLFFFSLIANATSFKQAWSPIQGAKFYEYEIANSASFKDNNLVRQGKVKTEFIKGSLNPGIYFLRVRAVGINGPGEWTSAKQFSLSSGEPELKWPLANETILISKYNSEMTFEWKTVSGADDYILKLRNLKNPSKKYSFISANHSLSTTKITTGPWSAQVIARANKTLFSQSKTIEFDVEERHLVPPFIVQPFNDLELPATESWTLRWRRNIPGDRSEIILSKLGADKHVVSQFWVKKQNEIIMPRLVPGRYQISVRDYFQKSDKFSETSVHITMKNDNFSHLSSKIGSSLRLMGAVRGLWHAQKNFGTGNDSWLMGSSYEPEIKFRLAGKIYRKIGYETNFGLQFPKYVTADHDYDGKSILFNAGASWSEQFMGPQNYLRFKLITTYRQIPQMISPDFKGHFVLWGLKPAVEFQWSAWRSYWDFWSEFSLDFPMLSSGKFFGTGSPRRFMPSMELSLYLRRQISSTWKILAGPSFYLESLSVSESDRSVKTRLQKAQAIFNAGLEWDL